jgi:hypothetical protein
VADLTRAASLYRDEFFAGLQISSFAAAPWLTVVPSVPRLVRPGLRRVVAWERATLGDQYVRVLRAQIQLARCGKRRDPAFA